MDNREFNLLMLFAARYAIGRMSAAPSTVADLLIKHKDELTKDIKNLIINEIEITRNAGCLGMDCDISTWEEVIKELKE